MLQIKYREIKKYKYELLEAYVHDVGICPAEDIITRYVSLLRSGQLIISERYAWDGPSGPTVDTDDTKRGSLVHDALYQLMKLGYLSFDIHQPVADALLREICLEDAPVMIAKMYSEAAAVSNWFKRKHAQVKVWLYERTYMKRFDAWYEAVKIAGKIWSQSNGEPGEDPVLTAP